MPIYNTSQPSPCQQEISLFSKKLNSTFISPFSRISLAFVISLIKLHFFLCIFTNSLKGHAKHGSQSIVASLSSCSVSCNLYAMALRRYNADPHYPAYIVSLSPSFSTTSTKSNRSPFKTKESVKAFITIPERG